MAIHRKLLFSDIHLQVLDNLGTSGDFGISTRTHYKIKRLRDLVDIAIEGKIDEIVDLGDTFTYLNPPDKLRVAYIQAVKKALDSGIAWTRILGNHETDGQYGVGVDASLISRDLYRVISDIDFCNFVPQVMYIPELSVEKIQQALIDNPNHLVIGHFGVEGVEYPSGMIEKDGLSRSLFKDRKNLTFLGHIHKGQDLVNGSVNYIGALFKHDFGDASISTGYFILEFDIDRKDRVSFGWEPFKDIGLHKFCIQEGEEPTFEVFGGDVVKLVYQGTPDWFSQIDVQNTVRMLKAAGAEKVMVSFEPSGQSEMIDKDFSDGFNFRDIIKEQAEKDGKDSAIGLKYFEGVL